jgi:hypothetical protein
MINNYLLSYTSEDRSIQYGFKLDEETTHYYVVREFLQFLSSIYGYDLTEKYLGNSPSDT